MSDGVSGTIVLDGLIEGRVPDDLAVEEALNQWHRELTKLGLPLELDISGNTFSLLPDATPRAATRLGSEPESVILQAIEELMRRLPPALHGQVFSTLRSVRYKDGEAVQALYLVEPGGRVRLEERTVTARTSAAPVPMTGAKRIKMILIALVIALAVLGVTGIFFDLREVFGQLVGTIKPLDVAAIQYDAASMSTYVEITGIERMRGRPALLVSLKRKGAYPRDPAARESAHTAAATLAERMAIEALARGYVRVELFDEHGAFVLATTDRIRDLDMQESIQITVPLPPRVRPARIVLCP